MGQRFLSDNRETFGKARPREGTAGFEDSARPRGRTTVLRAAAPCAVCHRVIPAGKVALVMAEGGRTWHDGCASPWFDSFGASIRDVEVPRSRVTPKAAPKSGPASKVATPAIPTSKLVRPAHPGPATAKLPRYVRREALPGPLRCFACRRPFEPGTTVLRGNAGAATFRWHLACAPAGIERRG